MSNATNEAGSTLSNELWVGCTHGNIAALRDGSKLVATMANDGFDIRNAEEIARRWNAHPDILAACEAMLAAHGNCGTPREQKAADLCAAAIAKARGRA